MQTQVANINPERVVIQRNAEAVLSQRSLWHFCRISSPDFYKPHRKHLKELCDTLQNIYEGKPLSDGKVYKKLIINMPPQHGKSRTLINFCKWVLGKNKKERIISCSYNDGTASDFSRYTRDGIAEDKNNPLDLAYSDIFPESKIKKGNSSFQKWALEGEHFNYLGAGVGGSITSKGATILLIDDPIKGAIEALNENHLDSIWTWYTSTFLSRVSAEEGEPLEIICMTRWSKKDICGRLLSDAQFRNEWYVLKLEAYDKETDKMLCPDFLSKKRYNTLKALMEDSIFSANYHQEGVDVKGRLYTTLKTYDTLPCSHDGSLLFTEYKNYTDTADQGSDYLCSVSYGVYNGLAYVLDVYYTLDGMEVTEPELARRLVENGIRDVKIESNNGGRGFARNVDREIKEKFSEAHCSINWFHQSKNKKARILSESKTVQDKVLFPADWRVRWPEFYGAVTSYQKEGKNKNDDAPDTLTGVVENIHNVIEFLR